MRVPNVGTAVPVPSFLSRLNTRCASIALDRDKKLKSLDLALLTRSNVAGHITFVPNASTYGPCTSNSRVVLAGRSAGIARRQTVLQHKRLFGNAEQQAVALLAQVQEESVLVRDTCRDHKNRTLKDRN